METVSPIPQRQVFRNLETGESYGLDTTPKPEKTNGFKPTEQGKIPLFDPNAQYFVEGTCEFFSAPEPTREALPYGLTGNTYVTVKDEKTVNGEEWAFVGIKQIINGKPDTRVGWVRTKEINGVDLDSKKPIPSSA